MATTDAQPPLFYVLREDVPADLVDKLLKRQRDVELFMKVSIGEWKTLEKQYPQLNHYIAMTAYEVSKGDPVQRERIAASLLGFCQLLDEYILRKTAARLEARWHMAATKPTLGD